MNRIVCSVFMIGNISKNYDFEEKKNFDSSDLPSCMKQLSRYQIHS